ncbi:MAG: hypothetical protein AAB947_01140 [Patescibacteria group bacterium]
MLQAWLKAKKDKKKRGEIIAHVVAVTNVHPKGVARSFKRVQMRDPCVQEKRGRNMYYTLDVRNALHEIWKAADESCGENLHPMIREYVDILMRDDMWDHDEAVTHKLRAMSARTVRRMTETFEKSRGRGKGKSSTKPSALKNIIPIFKGPWKDLPPGYKQIDAVALCGDTLFGDFIYILSAIDVCLYWYNFRAQWNKGQHATMTSLEHVERESPVPVIEFHPDTGSEFINWVAKGHCDERDIRLTRSELGKKNDNMYVEERNGHIARRYLGYTRFDCPDCLLLINTLCEILELYLNHFRVVKRQLSRKRVGAKYVRTFEKVPLSPYQRLLAYPLIPYDVKEKMRTLHATLNPLLLKRKIDTLLKDITNQQSRHKNDSCRH